MTESEEMYLLSIIQMNEHGKPSPIPVGLLAEQLGVLPVSANQMIHKLEADGWLEYAPYKGVSLTAEGQLVAQRVLHHRRVWKVFLVRHLELPLEEADSLACRLEHITPDEVAFKLAAYLGNPAISPEGDPIPALPGETYRGVSSTSLANAPLQEQMHVVEIPTGSVGSFLVEAGIQEGKRVSLLGKSVNGAILVQIDAGSLHLSGTIASQVMVRPVADRTACESFCSAYSFKHRQESHG